MKAKHQFRIKDASQDRQPEIQSSLVREDFQRIKGQTNNNCRSQIIIFTNCPRQQRSLVGRQGSRLKYVLVHNFLRKLCMWIKEVELVDSVDDLKSSCSARGIRMPDFESTRCEDCFSTEQNHPQFSLQKKNQSGGTKSTKRGPFPSRKTDRLLDLRVLLGHWSQ